MTASVQGRARGTGRLTREHILAAAMQLYARGDPTMKEIAEQAGIALPTLYLHFPGRAMLVGECLDEVRRRISARLPRAPVLAQFSSAQHQVRMIIESAFEAYESVFEHASSWWHVAEKYRAETNEGSLDSDVGALLEKTVRARVNELAPSEQKRLISTTRALGSFLAYRALRTSGNLTRNEAASVVVGLISESLNRSRRSYSG